jgi:hypothetical protein
MHTTHELISSDQVQKLGPAGLRAFFELAKLWDLSAEQQRTLLGNPARSTFFDWKKSPQRDLTRDTVERLSYFIGIFKALQIIFHDSRIADRWIHQPADIPPFGGKTPLGYMLRGDISALYEVRRYLDAWLSAR